MPDFAYAELLPRREDDTPFRLLTREGVRTVEALGRTFLEVEPEALRLLTETAMHDIAHFLRPAHLAQLRRITQDPEASPNDRFVALDLQERAARGLDGADAVPAEQPKGRPVLPPGQRVRVREVGHGGKGTLTARGGGRRADRASGPRRGRAGRGREAV